MPRDGSGVYHTPAGTDAVPDTTIESTKYNTNVHDVEADLNLPRPVVAGGTGSTTAAGALINFGGELAKQIVTNYDSNVFVPGSFYSSTTATNPPVAGHAFAGTCYAADATNMVIDARDLTDPMHFVYSRIMSGGVWGSYVPASYVNKTGDTMTGNLVINGAAASLSMNAAPPADAVEPAIYSTDFTLNAPLGHFTYNAYVGTGPTWKRLGTGYAATMGVDNVGIWGLSNAITGPAGSTITWQSAMSFNPAGGGTGTFSVPMTFTGTATFSSNISVTGTITTTGFTLNGSGTVNGNLTATNALISNSQIIASGPTTLYSTVYAGGAVTAASSLQVNGELIAVQNYVRFGSSGSAGYIIWSGGPNYDLGGGGRIWHSGNFNPAASAYVTNARLAMVADVALPYSGGQWTEPYGGSVITGMYTLSMNGIQFYVIQYVRYRQLQLLTSSWFAIGYA